MSSLNALRREAESWLEGLGSARSSAAPGPADLAAVDRAHPELVDPATAVAIRALLGSEHLAEEQRPRLRLLIRFLEDASARAAARAATDGLERALWAPTLSVENGPPSILEAEAALATTPERAVRLSTEAALDRAWQSLGGWIERREEAMAGAARALGTSGWRTLREQRRGEEKPVDPVAFLRGTEDAYRDVLGWALGHIAPRLVPWPRGDARLSDLDRVRALPFYPGVLEPRAREEALRAWQTTVLDGDPSTLARLRLRPLAAAPEAEGIAVEVPGRVELLLPSELRGAVSAPAAFLWRGWGLHLAATEADAPVEHRWMGDAAVRWASGWLVRGLLWSERWLQRTTRLGRAAAREVARLQALLALMELRGSAALHPFVEAWAERGASMGGVDEASEAVSAAIGVRVGAGRTLGWLARLDPELRMLRAASLSVLLRDEADRRFDAEEFRNPLAAQWLRAVWARGAPESAERMAPALCGRALEVEPLTRRLVGVLGA
jgi:hypothetical protein